MRANVLVIAVIVAPIRVKNNRLAARMLSRRGERHPRVWADQDVWLPYVDILKMNLDEASSTWLGESAEVTADPPRLSDEQVRDLAHHCLDRGVGAVCVALGERGCVTFFRDGSGGVAEKFVDRIEVEHVVDTGSPAVPVIMVSGHRPGNGGHRPPRVRLAMAISAPGPWNP